MKNSECEDIQGDDDKYGGFSVRSFRPDSVRVLLRLRNLRGGLLVHN